MARSVTGRSLGRREHGVEHGQRAVGAVPLEQLPDFHRPRPAAQQQSARLVVVARALRRTPAPHLGPLRFEPRRPLLPGVLGATFVIAGLTEKRKQAWPNACLRPIPAAQPPAAPWTLT